MSTPALTDPATARDLLFGAAPGSAVEPLTASLHARDTVGALLHGIPRLTGAAGQAVEREVATALDRQLGRDLFGFAAAGWSRYTALTAAARRTRADPASEEVVALVDHRITSTNSPRVDLLVDGAPVGSVRMELTLVIELAGIVAVVRQARLVALRAGSCTVTGTLTVNREKIVQRSRRYDLPGAVTLRNGIPLLADETAPPGASAGTETPAAAGAETRVGAGTEARARAETQRLPQADEGAAARARAETERLPRTGHRGA
ncbi:hypothetical protein SAMN05216371_6950 [Streptomyces sp. TLI_053]|uniref:hypothetical protein n=1 Tax=Streptomyces sp. TLI_053 TaxID=1855352 RepID=UPI00087BB037|nr:hypothetical protein [Streptomyces sp. TLI_053]SDT82055.1 hypothetical protein SAMN05216371_6950 [Streptomyces sp. TLI_053]